jgi:glycosyltransferase involved in cell wall biosynthesis
MGMRITFPFPELVNGRNFGVRNRYFNERIHRAMMIFAESESGKNDLIKYANVPEEKIRVLPIFAGNVINEQVNDSQMREELINIGVKEHQYFFYPAQFWAHKNHITVLKAFSRVVNNNPNLKLVFTGSDKSNKKYVENYCKKLGIDKNVIFLGFVSNEALYTLYKNAAALVMASYFGETNMPPIEAMNIGCPVICSDILGHREILGDAGLYFKAWNCEELEKQMIEVLDNYQLYKNKVSDRKKSSIFNVDYSVHRLDTYLYEVSQIREAWE